MSASLIKRLAPLFALGLLFGLAQSVYASGSITGKIQFEPETRMGNPAEWTRVYLVRGKVPIPTLDPEHGLINHTSGDRINLLHHRFYTNLQRQMSEPDFLAGTALAASDGSFEFTGIASGRYFVVVAFPSLIDGYKVAWQLPVSLEANYPATVQLDQTNLALPTFSRSHGTAVIEAGM